MSERQALRRLRAYQAGQPLPQGETKPIWVTEDQDILILSFVRMGGESRPWGIAFGQPGKTPTILSVPEARNRDLVAAMVLKFAPTILKHFNHPDLFDEPPDGWEDLEPITQIWLANSTHLDMLHHLGFAYSWTQAGEDNRPTLNAFGRMAGWLFRESQRPGQMQVMVATQALRDLYTFPTEDARQGHLGFLLAWLNTAGNYDTRLKEALAAETRSIATSLDPALERKPLQPLLETWGDADKSDQQHAKKQTEQEMHNILSSELERRWKLTEQAIATIRNDPRRTNDGVDVLVTESLKERWYQYVRLELNKNDNEDGPAFFPSVETDRHPAAAAARYNVYQASTEMVESILIHDDRELLAEAIDAGDAIEGEIVEVEDIGVGRQTRPIWTICDTAPRQLRLRVGSRVAAHGFAKKNGRVVAVEQEDNGNLLISVEILGQKTNRNPGPGIHRLASKDKSLVGETAAFVTAPAHGISRSKSFRIWDREGPGAWLTHHNPSGRGAWVEDDDSDDVARVNQALEAQEEQ